MKKIINLLSIIVLLISYQNAKAQQMPVPDPNTANVLFLKFSKVSHSPYAFTKSLISVSNERTEWRPSYVYIEKFPESDNTPISDLFEIFYTPAPDDFAYIDPSVYNAVSLDITQLAAVLKHKDQIDRQSYLKNFHTIYLIDYDQKNPKATSKVKILKVRPYYEWEHR